MGKHRAVARHRLGRHCAGDTGAPGRRNEWTLISFTATTNAADAVIRVTLPLLAIRTTHSPFAVSLVAVMMSLPWLVTSLHIGVLVDRKNRRTLMVRAESLRLAAAGVLLAALFGHLMTVPLIYVMALVLGFAEVVAMISGASILPSAVHRSRWEVTNARITAVEYLSSTFLGAPLGGLLVAAGFAFALGATAALYVSGALLLLILVGNFAAAAEKPRSPARVEIAEGIRFLLGHRVLRTMAAVTTVTAGSWAAWYALLPVYAVGGPLGLDSRQYGLVLTCLGVGGVAGTALVGPLNRLLGRRWSMFAVIIGSFVMMGVPAVLPPARGTAVFIGAAACLGGIGGTLWTINSRIISQSSVPNDLLGRYTAANRLVAWGMAPLAAVVGGALAQFVSYRVAFGAFAVLCLAVVYPFLRVMTAEAVGGIVGEIAVQPVQPTPRMPAVAEV
jgi:MFS family permease